MKCRNRTDQAGTKQGCKHSQYTFVIQNFLSFPNPSTVYNRRVIIASIKSNFVKRGRSLSLRSKVLTHPFAKGSFLRSGLFRYPLYGAHQFIFAP